MKKYEIWKGTEVIVTGLSDNEITLPEGVDLKLPRQTHTANIGIVRGLAEEFPETDGLISFDPGIAVGVRTADCQPVLLYAPDIRAVAAVHAGWRGTIAHIARKAVQMLKESGAEGARIKVFLGPSVCGECYEVSKDLVTDFRMAGFRRIDRDDHLDLARLNVEDLESAGVMPGNICTLGHCTLHTRAGNTYAYPSWRRTPGTSRRLISAVRLLG